MLPASGIAALRVQIASLVTLTTTMSGAPNWNKSAVMHANPGDDLRDQVLVVTHVRDHREARLDLVEHVADRVVRAVGLVDRRSCR